MLIFLLALASTAISIAVGARIPISARQSQRWNDEFVAEPIDFKATQISGCSYQIAYRQDPAETGGGRYDVSYFVRHGSSERRLENLITGNGDLHLSDIQPFLSYDRYFRIVQFDNACSSGASGSPPTAFRVFFSLRPGYTYKNDWWTDAISVTAGPNLAVPGGVTARPDGNRRTLVSWTPVADAGGYYIQVRGLVDSEVGDQTYYTTALVDGGATSSMVASGGRVNAVAVLARGVDNRVVSDFKKTPTVQVQ